MYLIKTFLKPSDIHGIGVFAAEFIPKGTRVWRYNPTLDIKVTQLEFETFDQDTQEFYTNYAHRNIDGSIILSADNSRFENHSDSPNIFTDSNDCDYALRDIMIGEEILGNYYEYDEYTKQYGI